MTSAAAPFVAGVAAMMKTLDPAIRQEQVLSILTSTAIPSTDPRVARGVVNALAALEAISPNVPPTLVVNNPLRGATVSPRGVRLSATVTDPDTKLPPAILVAWFDTDESLLCVGTLCDSGPLSLGYYTIKVKAVDEVGGLTETEVHIHVVNTAPTPAIALPGSGSVFFVGQLIAFQGTASDPDQDASSLQLAGKLQPRWSARHAPTHLPDADPGLLRHHSECHRRARRQQHHQRQHHREPHGRWWCRWCRSSRLPTASTSHQEARLIHFEGSGFYSDDGELPLAVCPGRRASTDSSARAVSSTRSSACWRTIATRTTLPSTSSP